MTPRTTPRLRLLPPTSLGLLALALVPFGQDVQLSTSAGPTVGDVEGHLQSPDARWVVYAADQDSDGVRELYSVPADGSAAPRKLNGPPASGPVGALSTLCELTPAGDRVLYAAPDASGTLTLFSVPIAGGASTRVSTSALDAYGVDPFQVSPDGLRVVYSSGFRLFNAPIDGGAEVQLSEAVVMTIFFTTHFGKYAITADSRWIVFESIESGEESLHLHARPLSGGPLVRLDPGLERVDEFGHTPFVLHPDSERVLFIAKREAGTPRGALHAARIDGRGLPLRLTQTHDLRSLVDSLQLDPEGRFLLYQIAGDLRGVNVSKALVRAREPRETLLATGVANGFLVPFGFGIHGDHAVYLKGRGAFQVDLWSVPLSGGVATQLSHTLPASGSVNGFCFTESGAVIYSADGTVDNAFQLFRVPITGGASTLLTPGAMAGRSVTRFEALASPARILYLADHDTDDVSELYSVPEAGGPAVRLNPPLFTDRAVRTFQATAGGRVIYLADQDENEVVEVYSVPAAGGAVAKLNAPLVREQRDDVRSFQFEPGGTHALYLADEATDDWPEVYRVPVDGSVPSVRIGPAPSYLGPVASAHPLPDGKSLVALTGRPLTSRIVRAAVDGSSLLVLDDGAPYTSFASEELSPDGMHLAYLATRFGVAEVRSVPIDGSRAPLRLDDAEESLLSLRIVAGGTRVVYIGFKANAYRLMSVPIDGGPPAQLSPAPATSARLEPPRFTADGSRALFLFGPDLYSVPVDGSAPALRLNQPLASGRRVWERFEPSPDGRKVVFAANEDSTNEFQLFSAPVDGGATPVRISGPYSLQTTFRGPDFQIAPRGGHVVFLRLGATELYSVSLSTAEHALRSDGMSFPVRISATLAERFDTTGDWAPYAISPDGERVVYVAPQERRNRQELYSVPIDGRAAPVKLNPPFSGGRRVLFSQRDFDNRASSALLFSSTSQCVVFLIATQTSTYPMLELFEAPLDGSQPAQRLHAPLSSGGTLHNFEVRASRALFRAQQDAAEVIELRSSPLVH